VAAFHKLMDAGHAAQCGMQVRAGGAVILYEEDTNRSIRGRRWGRVAHVRRRATPVGQDGSDNAGRS